jgi:hypothetical protein
MQLILPTGKQLHHSWTGVELLASLGSAVMHERYDDKAAARRIKYVLTGREAAQPCCLSSAPFGAPTDSQSMERCCKEARRHIGGSKFFVSDGDLTARTSKSRPVAACAKQFLGGPLSGVADIAHNLTRVLTAAGAPANRRVLLGNELREAIDASPPHDAMNLGINLALARDTFIKYFPGVKNADGLSTYDGPAIYYVLQSPSCDFVISPDLVLFYEAYLGMGKWDAVQREEELRKQTRCADSSALIALLKIVNQARPAHELVHPGQCFHSVGFCSYNFSPAYAFRPTVFVRRFLSTQKTV